MKQLSEYLIITQLSTPKEIKEENEYAVFTTMSKAPDSLTYTSLDVGTSYQPSAKDRLYFYPNCSVPRHKVREWGSKYNVSITNKQEAATHCIVSKTSMKEFFTSFSGYRIPRLKFFDWLLFNYGSIMTGESPVQKLLQAVENNTKEFVILAADLAHAWGNWALGNFDHYGYNYAQQSKDAGIRQTLLAMNPGLVINGEYLTFVKQHKVKDLLEFMEDTRIVSEEALIGHVNEDCVVIDTHLFKELNVMLKSTEEKDQVLAMEIMASSHLLKSCHLLLLLLQDNWKVITDRKEKNHVNFKSMLIYLGVKDTWMGKITPDVIIESLMDKDILTMETLKEISEEVKESFKSKTDTDHFKISKITVSDEVKEYFRCRLEAQEATQ